MSMPLRDGSRDVYTAPTREASTGATISAAITAAPHVDAAELRGLGGRAGCLEVRADLVGDVDPRWLRQHFRGELLYSLRSAAQGGAFAGTERERHDRLFAAAEQYDLIDLEEERDLSPELLRRIPTQRRRLSWHGRTSDTATLRACLARMVDVGARLYVLAPAITRAEEALVPLLFLKESGRSDVTAFGTGRAGMWSRILAPWLGAQMIYGRLGDAGDSGVPTVKQLVEDYGFPNMPPLDTLYGIVGRSVYRSVSPRLHNAGYRQLGLPALYLPFQVEEFLPFWQEVVERGLRYLGFPLRGATVVSPHKEAALTYATMVSATARRAASASALVRVGGFWRADTSNSPAVIEALARAMVPLQGRRVAVIGCGGAGRAAAVALCEAGANTVLVNRGEARGRYAAELLELPFVPLAEFSPRQFDLVVHATPFVDEPLFRVDDLSDEAAVVDMVYSRAGETAVVAAARGRGLTVVDGWDVLLCEIDSQFHMMTGQRIAVPQTRTLLWATRDSHRPLAATTHPATEE